MEGYIRIAASEEQDGHLGLSVATNLKNVSVMDKYLIVKHLMDSINYTMLDYAAMDLLMDMTKRCCENEG